MRKFQKLCNNFKRNIPIQYNDFAATTSMPGFKFTAHSSAAKRSKIFWHVVYYLALYTALIICFGFYDQYENKAILTVLEILEQGSELPYPSVYLCLGYPLSPERMRKMREEILKTENITIPLSVLDGPIQSALRFQRSTRNDSFNLDDLFKYDLDMNKLQDNLPQLYYQVDELLKDCHVQGIRYRCKNIFKPLETGPGFCFVFNSIYTADNFNDNPNMIRFQKFSELDEDWTIRFTISKIDTSILIFLKEPREILAMTDFPSYIWHPSKNISKYGFTARNHYAEQNVRTLRQSQRKCIYVDEVLPYDDLRQEFSANFYNKGLCLSYCHAMEFLRYCQCLPTSNLKIMPNISKKRRICSLKDIRCIEDNYSKVRQTDCFRCMLNCNCTEYLSRPEIRLPGQLMATGQKQKASTKNDFYELTIDLEYWPNLQYRTLIIVTTTEFLISLMGLAGLFVGTSFLTTFEAFYCLFIRFWCSYYVNWDYLEREFRKQEEKERSQPLPCIDMSVKVPIKM